MKILGAIFVFFCLTPAFSADWPTSEFKNIEISSIETAPFYRDIHHPFTHKYDLSILVFRNAGWELSNITERMKLVAQTYLQCRELTGGFHLKLDKISVTTVDANEQWLEPQYDDHKKTLTDLIPIKHRPLLIYIRNDGRKKIDQKKAFAYPRYMFKDDEQDWSLIDTAWQTNYQPDTNSIHYKWRDKKFVDETHELGHVLMDMGHFKKYDKNLMSLFGERLDSTMTAEQCQRLAASPLIEKL